MDLLWHLLVATGKRPLALSEANNCHGYFAWYNNREVVIATSLLYRGLMNGTTSSYLREIKRQHEAGTLTQEQATEFIVITLIDQAMNGETLVNRLDELEGKMDKKFDELSRKIDDTIKHQKDHPSLI